MGDRSNERSQVKSAARTTAEKRAQKRSERPGDSLPKSQTGEIGNDRVDERGKIKLSRLHEVDEGIFHALEGIVDDILGGFRCIGRRLGIVFKASPEAVLP